MSRPKKSLDSHGDRVYVAVCAGGFLVWTNVSDNNGYLQEDVTMKGEGNADAVVDASGTIDDPYICGLTCYGEVQLNGHTVALEGGSGNDFLWSRNDSGLVTFDGGDNDDWVQHAGDYPGNVLIGGLGNDTIVDNGSGGGGDYLYGGAGDDCLQAECIIDMDCGGGTADRYSWAGVAACCSGDLCPTPTNCETWGACI